LEKTMTALQDPRTHDDLLNFQLKRLLRKSGAPAIRLCEGRFGVTRSEWRLVAALVEHGPTSRSALSQYTQLDQARLSRILETLLAKNLVERHAVAGDHRRLSLAATERGRQLYAELFPQLALINRRLMEALDEQEAACLERCLSKLTECARQIYDSGGGVDSRTERRLGGSRRFWPSLPA
jgi:DNA-binding MarR family transcriptional regulator